MKLLKLLTFVALSHNVFAVEPYESLYLVEYKTPSIINPPIYFTNTSLEYFRIAMIPDGNGGFKTDYTLIYYSPTPTGHPAGSFGDMSGNATIAEKTDTTYRQWRGFIFYSEFAPNPITQSHRIYYVTTDSDWIFRNGFD